MTSCLLTSARELRDLGFESEEIPVLRPNANRHTEVAELRGGGHYEGGL